MEHPRNECAPSEVSDQSGHPESDQRLHHSFLRTYILYSRFQDFQLASMDEHARLRLGRPTSEAGFVTTWII